MDHAAAGSGIIRVQTRAECSEVSQVAVRCPEIDFNSMTDRLGAQQSARCGAVRPVPRSPDRRSAGRGGSEPSVPSRAGPVGTGTPGPRGPPSQLQARTPSITFSVSHIDGPPSAPYLSAAMRTRHTALAEAHSPDADRASPDAPTESPDWLVHLLALFILFARQGPCHLASLPSGVPAWCHDRPDLPPGSAQALAASVRVTFGRAIEWMCRRRGIGPGHPDWPELARAIVAFGGSVHGFRPGLPACGLQWWENPAIIPGMIGMAAATPAANAMALLLSRQAMRTRRRRRLTVAPAAAEPAVAPAPMRPVLVRADRSADRAASRPGTSNAVTPCTGPRHGRPRRPNSCRRHAVAARCHARSNVSIRLAQAGTASCPYRFSAGRCGALLCRASAADRACANRTGTRSTPGFSRSPVLCAAAQGRF